MDKHHRETMDIDGDEEAKDGWEGWEVGSDSDESSSDSEGWVDVSSDGEDLVLSDSEDEKENADDKGAEKKENSEEANPDLTDVGTTKVCVWPC